MSWRPTIKIRRLVPMLLVASVLATAAAGPPMIQPVFHSSFKAASDAAASDHSLVLLIFGAEWCGPCKLLKNNTLSSPEFLQQDSPLHVAEVDIDANPKMTDEFAIQAVPTLILLTADGKIIARQTGYLDPADLSAWLKAGRAHAAAGQWEGIVPGRQFDEFIKKAAADDLTTNDLHRLVSLLGDPDPANREQAGKILLSQRERAVPLLIAAVGNPYLGVRIAASEFLQRLAPNLEPVDPWQSPTEMSNVVIALQEWWADKGELTPAPASATNSVSADSIKEALEQLREKDPERSTAAMTALVNCGTSALPAVREAIQLAERNSDQRTLALLEDVRWTILVPDSVERQSGGVRAVLAHGKSSDRQAAAESLGRVGHNALGTLAELANDSDPLVVESAIRALSNLGGNDTVPALAALVHSPDSNLRMTAAQALGHTKSTKAVKPLLTTINDPDEVVACTALSALEEIESGDNYMPSRNELPRDVLDGLSSCLADSRWRVRAAAAGVVGKLNAGSLSDNLKKLLSDSDGFVVKNALTALGQLHAAPEPAQLAALSKRLPGLQSDAVAMMLQSDSDDVAKTVTELFESGDTDARAAILNALAQNDSSDSSKIDGKWRPLLAQAVAATDPRLRRGAAMVLGQCPPKLAAELIGPLLADEDRETRVAAAEVVLRILGPDKNGSRSLQVFPSAALEKTNQPATTATQLAKWHAQMLKHAEPAPGLSLAAAIYVTGDGRSNLPVLQASLQMTNSVLDQSRAQQQADLLAIGLILSRLPWPEGQPVLDQISASPVWFAMAASESGRGNPAIADYLLEPARFKSAVERVADPALSVMLQLLAGYDYESGGNRQWSLWIEDDRTKAIDLALLESTNAAWRAAALFSLGLRADAKGAGTNFETFLNDASPWVRISAIRAIARNAKDRAVLEQTLGPALADKDSQVATAAAVALLEPETRKAAGLGDDLNYFEFEDVRGGRSQTSNQNDDRPLTPLNSKPPFLQQARNWLAATNVQGSMIFALLLAQYGEFDGVDRMGAQLPALNSDSDQNGTDTLLAGIALSRDIRYLPVLRRITAGRRDEWALRKVLQAMQGMTGREARQLRLDINKKIRSAGGSMGIPDQF